MCGTVMSIARIGDWVGAVEYCLVEEEERAGNGQKEYADTNKWMLEAARRHFIRNVMEIVTHCPSEEVTVEEDELSSRELKEVVIWDVEDSD